MDYNKIIIALVVILIVIAVGGFVMFNQAGNKTTTNTTNATNTTNTTNVNLTNNTTNNAEPNQNQNNHDSEYTQGKVNPKDVPSDIYSRWDTDGDGKFSSSEMDAHDKALGQGKYYTGPENMKDSVNTYPN
ncbi:hypothetical protein [Methanobrevibacter sp.]|uniref:hypothetical protein n=1 Tax=Methanobrevibacter sp. TaxID=66852 RepID=UPI00388E3C40